MTSESGSPEYGFEDLKSKALKGYFAHYSIFPLLKHCDLSASTLPLVFHGTGLWTSFKEKIVGIYQNNIGKTGRWPNVHLNNFVILIYTSTGRKEGVFFTPLGILIKRYVNRFHSLVCIRKPYMITSYPTRTFRLALVSNLDHFWSGILTYAAEPNGLKCRTEGFFFYIVQNRLQTYPIPGIHKTFHGFWCNVPVQLTL